LVRSRSFDASKHVRAILLLQVIVTIVIPALLHWQAGTPGFDTEGFPSLALVATAVGAVLALLGLILVIQTVPLFANLGKGTLAP